jgi:hypothetical protein
VLKAYQDSTLPLKDGGEGRAFELSVLKFLEEVREATP